MSVIFHFVGRPYMDFCQRIRHDGYATACWCLNGCDCAETIDNRFANVRWLFRHHYWSKLW